MASEQEVIDAICNGFNTNKLLRTHLYPGHFGYVAELDRKLQRMRKRGIITTDGRNWSLGGDDSTRPERRIEEQRRLALEALNHLYGMNAVAESDRTCYEAAKKMLDQIIPRPSPPPSPAHATCLALPGKCCCGCVTCRKNR